jgi:hypothetical protein
MNNFSKTLITALAFCGLLWSCTADKVAPKGEAPTLGKFGENPHPIMNPGCSDTAFMRLQSTDGSFKVNNLSGANQPDWGSVYILNGNDSIGIYITMATGQMIDFAKSRLDIASNFSFDSNGRPVTINDFQAIDVNPLVNKYALFLNKNDISKDANNCFAIALNLTILRASFLGTVIPGSVRNVWAYNTQWDNAQSQFASPSPYLLNWCWELCPPVWPEPVAVCAKAYTGMPGNNGCASISPDVTGATGTLTYAWDNGSTAASLTVCPTATTTYRVSVSDANGPFSVTDFNVNVADVNCRAGNSPHHKVRVCHIPPGNPANQQNICIDWSGVPAHVERFRPLGSNGLPVQMGHNSGCEIGVCGSNPCL